MSKASQANTKWQKKAYDRIIVTIPKGEKEKIKKHAEQHDKSLNAFIKRAIERQMEEDDWK